MLLHHGCIDRGMTEILSQAIHVVIYIFYILVAEIKRDQSTIEKHRYGIDIIDKLYSLELYYNMACLYSCYYQDCSLP